MRHALDRALAIAGLLWLVLTRPAALAATLDAFAAATPGYEPPPFDDVRPDYARIARDARLDAEADAWLRSTLDGLPVSRPLHDA